MSAPIDASELRVVGKPGGYVGLDCPECGWTWTSNDPLPLMGAVLVKAIRHTDSTHEPYPEDSLSWGPSHDR
jgi:hypothetical protein